MLGLARLTQPPLECFVSPLDEGWLANGAEGQITAIEEDRVTSAASTTLVGLFGVALVEFCCEIMKLELKQGTGNCFLDGQTLDPR